MLVDVAYTITSGATASQLAQTSCQLAGTTSCFDHKWVMTLLFGAVEMVLSQVRNLEEAWWVSALGVVCSIVYSIVALGLSAAKGELGWLYRCTVLSHTPAWTATRLQCRKRNPDP